MATASRPQPTDRSGSTRRPNRRRITMSETYETLRDSATGEAKTAWDAVDRERTKLREYYRQLEEDPKFADDYKSEQAWARYQSAREKIEAHAPKAREALE